MADWHADEIKPENMEKRLDCRIPFNSSCSGQPPKIAMPLEQALGMKGSATG